jgi:hypothetical protein
MTCAKDNGESHIVELVVEDGYDKYSQVTGALKSRPRRLHMTQSAKEWVLEQQLKGWNNI